MKLKEKVLTLQDYPRYVQMGVYKHMLYLVLLVGITLASFLAFRSLTIFVFGAVMSLIYGGVVYHIYYSLTRDNMLCMDGYCHEVMMSEMPLGKLTRRKTYVVVKPEDKDNTYTYLIPYRKNLSKCNEGDKVSFYTFQSGVYMNADDNVVVNTPVFLKVTK